jgi:uncharacterized protein (TIGR00159 family)
MLVLRRCIVSVESLLALGWQDGVDIALVSTLVYTAIVLVRRTRAAFVAIGILMLGALYIAARALDLRLTAWLLQGFFAVLLIILVVIFQEELRQLFERIALYGMRRSGERRATLDPTDIVVRCAAVFAHDRIGALIVLTGTQPVSRHIQGGIELGGRLSVPLLKSIFDPHSPGHDGAVIVEGDRIARFAAQLPLSTDFGQLTGRGTRHGAALGLAERTDALCLVVSEERGEVSVANRGRLVTLGQPHEVGFVVREFLSSVNPQERKGFFTRFVRENWVEKLASVALVMALWYLFIPGSRPSTFVYTVPVKVENLSPGYVVDSIDPAEVTVVFSGLRRAFYLFDAKRLAVSIDATLASEGRKTFTISGDEIDYPDDLTLAAVKPNRVRVSLRRAPPEAEPKG